MAIFWFVLTAILASIGIWAFIKNKQIVIKIASFIFAGISAFAGVYSCIQTTKETEPTTTPPKTTDVSKQETPVLNTSFDDALPIQLNQQISDTFEKNQTLYYSFILEEKASVQINVNHIISENSSSFCTVYLYSDNDLDNAFYESEVDNGVANTTLNKMRKPEGKYYLVIELRDTETQNTQFDFTVAVQSENNSYESEPNNEISSANTIAVNSPKIGNSENSEDSDYFVFSLDAPHKVSITFQHNIYDSTDTFWVVSLFSEESTEILAEKNISGGQETTETDIINLSPRQATDYYVKITPQGNAPTDDYKICIKAEATQGGDSGTVESEPNNSIQEATPVKMNTKIEGNTQSDNDVDYYQFTVKSNGKINIQFEHPYYDSTDCFWKVSVLSENSETDYPTIEIYGNKKKTSLDTIRVSPGTYYLKVEPHYSYSNDIYNFKINYKKS